MRTMRILFIFAACMLFAAGVFAQPYISQFGSKDAINGLSQSVARIQSLQNAGKGNYRVIFVDNSGIQRDTLITSLADTASLYATKSDFNAPKELIVEAHSDHNERIDNPQVVKDPDSVKCYFTYFEDATGDLSTAHIAYVSGNTYNAMNRSQTVKIAINKNQVPNALSVTNQSVAFQPNGDQIMIFLASYSSFPSFDSLRTRWFKSKKVVGSNVWSTPVEVYNGNNYSIGRAGNIFKVTATYWVMPYSVLISGPGNSATSVYYVGVLKSYDAGETWVAGPANITDGATGEGHIVKDLNGNISMLVRTKFGYIGRVNFFSDTSFTKPSSIVWTVPAQNALSSSFYYEPKNILFLALMRYDGYDAASNRIKLDILNSDNGYTWMQEDNIDFTKTGAVLNEPYFALDSTNVNDPLLRVYYSRTGIGNTLYSLWDKVYHLNDMRVRKQVTFGETIFHYAAFNNNPATTNTNSNAYDFYLPTRAAGTRAFAKSYAGGSQNPNEDSLKWFYAFDASSPSQDQSMRIRLYNTDTFKKTTAISIQAIKGFGQSIIQIKKDTAAASLPALDVYPEQVVVPTSTQYEDSYRKPYGLYENMDNGMLGVRMFGKTYYASETLMFPLGAGNFAADSSYTDSVFIGRYITARDTNGKFLKNGRDWEMQNGVKFKLKTRAAPSGTDTIYVEINHRYVAGRMPRILPLDSFNVGTGCAFSFSKLLTNYTGYCVRLKSSVTGELKDFAFGRDIYLDTFEVKRWAYWDSCTIDFVYNQVTTLGTFFGLIPLNPAIPPKFRLRNGRAYIEFSGGSSLTANSTVSRSALAFLHSDFATTSFVGELNSVTTTSIYGLWATCQATTTATGAYWVVDNRIAQSRAMANSIGMVRGVSSQSTASQVINNGGIVADTKFIAMHLGDMANVTALNRIMSYINGGAAQQANILTNTQSTASATTTFTIGSTGGLSIMTGKLYEFIAIPQKLTDTQRQALRNNQNSRYQVY